MQITKNTYINRQTCIQTITNTCTYIYMEINIKSCSKIKMLYTFHEYIMIKN